MTDNPEFADTGFTADALASHRLRTAAQRLVDHADVQAVDVVERPDGAPVVECVVATLDGRRVPPSLLATIADAGLGVTDITLRGEPRHYIVTCDC